MEFTESSFSAVPFIKLGLYLGKLLKWGFDSPNGSLIVNEERKSLYLSRYSH